MGEAKRNREILKASVIEQMTLWNRPPSVEEEKAVTEVSRLPRLPVTRYPAHVLASMRMKPHECHANARFMRDADPEGKCELVSGYWEQMDNYVMHSVIRREGGLYCVTPTTIPMPDTFMFIPDPDIEWRFVDGNSYAYRKGWPLGVGLRGDPAETMRINGIMLARMEAGVHPMKAGEPPF